MGGLIIGTAGHVDHGKTALIEKMTGIDTDRLREEKERGLSIDLGFAPLRLPSGRLAGIVDVPGHEKFMTNMLAGVAGMDLVLLVIDLTEGIMPQTREHLEVIEILEIKKGVVVLTKADLVEKEWIELMEEEVREELSGTVFAGAPFVTTSAQTGEGIDKLLEILDKIAETRETEENAPLRLPLDRVFQMHGMGTVVTGTLISGQVKPGDEIEILPRRIRSRVRQVQVHNEKVEKAGAGQRVALNIPLDRKDLARGDVIATPGFFEPTGEMDVFLNMIDDFPHPLKDNSTVHFHLGTSRCLGKVKFYGDRRRLAPVDEALARIKLEEELVAGFQDRFIIRFYSPVHVMGGGRVLITDPPEYKRHDKKHVRLLERMVSGKSEDLLFQIIYRRGVIQKDNLILLARISEEEIEQGLKKLENEIQEIQPNYYVSRDRLEEFYQKFAEELNSYHRLYSLRPGMPRTQAVNFVSDISGSEEGEKLLNLWLEERRIKKVDQRIALVDFNPRPGNKEKQLADQYRDKLREGGFSPPLAWELGQKAGEILDYLAFQGEIVRVNEELYLTKDKYEEAESLLIEFLQEQGKITVAEFRNLLASTRKFALPLLEHFDDRKITKRSGDERLPGSAFAANEQKG